MDLDGDGNIDILSGSYSRMEGGMAGLFQVLWGEGGGKFRAAKPLQGTDGAPLIITPASEGEFPDVDRICTRPTAVDLDGDGKLDIVSGNFTGTFAWFRGEGDGRFEPKHTWLEVDGEPLRVEAHSDPFFVDFDGDGDLDLVSGSGSGGVAWFENTASKATRTKTEPKFAAAKWILEAKGYEMMQEEEICMGDAHIDRPQMSTRVCVADVNGDGKLDILVGDSAQLTFPAEGVDEATARQQLGEWMEAYEAAMSELNLSEEPSDEQMAQLSKTYEAWYEKRSKIVRDESTGFVWVLYQK